MKTSYLKNDVNKMKPFISGKGSQQKCFDRAEDDKFFVVYQRPIGDDIFTNTYSSFSNIESFLEYYSSVDDDDKRFYELIKNECPEYYDFDFEISEWDGIDKHAKINGCINEFLRVRNEFSFHNDINNMTIKQEDLVILESCGVNCKGIEKLSLHVIVRPEMNGRSEKFFSCCKDQKVFQQKFEEFLKKQDTKIVLDMSVYSNNSLMRLSGSHKKYENSRKFKPFGNVTKNIQDQRLMFCSYVKNTACPLVIHKPDVNNNEVTELDLELSNNEVKNIFNHLSASRWEEYESWRTLIWVGLKLGLTAGDIHEYSQDAKNYNENATTNMINDYTTEKCKMSIGTLFHYLKKDVTAEKYQELVKPHVVERCTHNKIQSLFDLRDSDYIRIIDVPDDVRWVQDIKFTEGYRAVGIKQYLGGGKTTAIIKYINTLQKDLKILVLSPRISFATSITKEYNDKLDEDQESFISYTDVKSKKAIGHYKRVVISMESIHYLENTKYIPDLIVMDECQANLMAHTSVDTNGKNLQNNIYWFNEMLMKSKNIIWADAFLGSKTTNFINALKIPTVIYNHKRKMEQRKMIEVTPDSLTKQQCKKIGNNNQLMFYIAEALTKNENNYCFCSSKNKAQDWYDRLTILFPTKKILLNTGGSKIGDIKKDWAEANCVITTATITVGVNFDQKDHFHNIFIYASSCSHNLVSDIFQSHFRVRHIINQTMYYFILPKVNKTLSTNYDQIKKDFNWKETYFMNKHKDFVITDNCFKQLVIDNQYEQHMSSMMLTKMFMFYSNQCNYTKDTIDDNKELGDIEFDLDMPDEKIDCSEQSFDEIYFLNDFEARELIIKQQSNNMLTDKEKLQLDKKLFVSCFSNRGIAWCDKAPVAILWGLWRDFGKTKIRMLRREKKINEQVSTIEQMMELQCHDMSIAGIQKNRLLKIGWIKNICETLGLKHSQDTQTKIPNELVQKMYKKMMTQETDIRKSFEIRDQRKEMETELTFTDCTKLLNSIFKNYGFTKFVKGKRLQKRIEGKIVDVSDYSLQTDHSLLKKTDNSSDLIYEYIELDDTHKKLLE